MEKFLSQRKKKTIMAALILGLCFSVSGYVHATNASEFETPEYFASSGLDVINAAGAYARGCTGQGITIGISDLPVNLASPEFNTKDGSAYVSGSYVNYIDKNGISYSVADRSYWQYVSHGTHVAGIAAASRNGLGMHGVAFDAQVASATAYDCYDEREGFESPDWAEPFMDKPEIITVNCSWVTSAYPTDRSEGKNFKSMDEYASLLDAREKEIVASVNAAAAGNKLLVRGAGNDGYAMPGLEVNSHWYAGKSTATNVLAVTALEATDRLTKSPEGIRGENIMAMFSNLAAFTEDATLAAPGYSIVSANSNFAEDGEIDTAISGTSMAAPHVAGAAALVQQAFPYMTGKQIGDLLLSTANPNVTAASGYTVTVQQSDITILNIYYFDGTHRTLEQQREDCLTFLRQEPFLAGWDAYINLLPICAHYNVPVAELVGQGVLDVGKAVDGPAALNARRLEKSDISSGYTVNGKAAMQALYKVDTQGCDSVWANDIREVRAGFLAADSTEKDLQKRYTFYKSNWLDQAEYDSGAPVVGADFVKAYIDFFNNNVYESGLAGLHVGLLKTGEGRLSLTGNNTYTGASIAQQGTLSIDGSIAGDAYSIDKGTIAGRGTIHGALYNQSIAVAGDAAGNGNLTVDKLVSSGVLLTQYQNGTNTQFIVKGEADINGSTVPLPIGAPTPMPDDRYAVVKAGSITGTAKELAGTEYELTGMLRVRNEIEGGTLSVAVEAANNLIHANASQNETFDAMTAMYRNLKNNNDVRANEMRTLFHLPSSEAKEALNAISSNAAAKNMAAVQRSNVTQHLLSARLNEAFTSKEAMIKIPVQHLNDSEDEGTDVSLKVLEPAENDIWLLFGKNWGEVRGDTDYHSTVTLLGWDKAVGKNWRAGVFSGYGQTSFSDNTSSDKLKDTRFGLYAGFNKAKSEGMVYLDYGWMRNKLRRSVMSMTASADYHSRILELGGEYLYDLQAGQNKAWHVRPYVNAQLSRLWQNGYREDGAGVYNQVVDSKHNDYFGMGAGVEFKRYLSGGNYAIRAGVKHAFAGAEPKLRYSYMGNEANSYDMRNVQDKTHFVLSIGGEVEVAKGWSVGGDATWQRSRHDKDLSCSVTVKRMW